MEYVLGGIGYLILVALIARFCGTNGRDEDYHGRAFIEELERR
jgi:hypothetical protein